MYARVARWEGVTPDALRRTTEMIKGSTEPPPGVPSNGIMVLIDEEAGVNVSIVLFESEEDMRQGDEALNAMSPEGEGVGTRTSVEMFEVAVDIRL